MLIFNPLSCAEINSYDQFNCGLKNGFSTHRIHDRGFGKGAIDVFVVNCILYHMKLQVLRTFPEKQLLLIGMVHLHGSDLTQGITQLSGVFLLEACLFLPYKSELAKQLSNLLADICKDYSLQWSCQ